MSVLVSLTSRTGDVAGPLILADVVPRVGEHVSFLTAKGSLVGAVVVKVSHAMFHEQRKEARRTHGSNVRVYVFLDVDDSIFQLTTE